MSALRWFAERRSMPDPLAGIDSETLLRALSRCHRGEDVPALGLAPRRAASILPYGNHLSTGTRQALYRRGTAAEAIDPATLGDVDVDDIRRWATSLYPKRGFPAVVIGSANGAAVHFAALLEIPWLPQTFLLPVRRTVAAYAPVIAPELARRRSPTRYRQPARRSGMAVFKSHCRMSYSRLSGRTSDRDTARSLAHGSGRPCDSPSKFPNWIRPQRSYSKPTRGSSPGTNAGRSRRDHSGISTRTSWSTLRSEKWEYAGEK